MLERGLLPSYSQETEKFTLCKLRSQFFVNSHRTFRLWVSVIVTFFFY